MKYINIITAAAVLITISPTLDANPLGEEIGAAYKIMRTTVARGLLRDKVIGRRASVLALRKPSTVAKIISSRHPASLFSTSVSPRLHMETDGCGSPCSPVRKVAVKTSLMQERSSDSNSLATWRTKAHLDPVSPSFQAALTRSPSKLSSAASLVRDMERQLNLMPKRNLSTKAAAKSEKLDSNFDWAGYVKILEQNCVKTVEKFDPALGSIARKLYVFFKDVVVFSKEKGFDLRQLDRGALEDFIRPATGWPHALKAAQQKITELPNDKEGNKTRNSIQRFTNGIKQFRIEIL